MNEDQYMRAELLAKTIESEAVYLIHQLKKDAKNYGELRRELKKLDTAFVFSGPNQAYSIVVKRAKAIVEETINATTVK